jgi:hypothetical protein
MAGKKHKGYNTTKLLIDSNKIGEFRQIFDYVPKTTVYKDLGINYNRFTRAMKNIQEFKLEEIYHLSRLIGIDEKILLDLAHEQYIADKATKRKK